MRKYLLNGALISAVLGIIPTIKKSKDVRSRSSAIVTWVLWAAGVVLAIAAIRDEAAEAREEEERGRA
ncbi:MAG: hypothetical protein GXX90_09145 [Microbacteriaceae bacterium]|nr:hypothetical protein [Microbacteriaceae bacterium]